MTISDIIEVAIQFGGRTGVIPMEIVGSFAFLFLGWKGYQGTKNGTDAVELLVFAGSIAALVVGVVGLLTVVIQLLSQ
jgi:hypothetical protein